MEGGRRGKEEGKGEGEEEKGIVEGGKGEMEGGRGEKGRGEGGNWLLNFYFVDVAQIPRNFFSPEITAISSLPLLEKKFSRVVRHHLLVCLFVLELFVSYAAILGDKKKNEETREWKKTP